MPNILAPVRAFITSVTGIIVLALLAALIVQTVRIEGFKFWPLSIHGYKAKYVTALTKLNEARAELDRISSVKNEQKSDTATNIDKAKERIVYVEREAGRVEAAPLPGDCKTPVEIMREPNL